MGTAESRWTRLERYARYKGNMRLLDLPPDVLWLVARFLEDASDVQSLVEACVGFPPQMHRIDHVGAIPHSLSFRWFERSATASAQHCIQRLAQSALFHCNGGSMVFLTDWSPFSKKPPLAVARCTWVFTPQPIPTIEVHETSLSFVVRKALRRSQPVVRLTLHHTTHWSERALMCPDPLRVWSLPLYPHQLIRYKDCMRE